MRWVAKAAGAKALSALPTNGSLHYVVQRRVTRSLPASDDVLRLRVRRALRHLRAFRRHSSLEPADAVFYEFGAGWDLAIPLAYWALGVGRQVLVDIRPNLRLELVNDMLRRFGTPGAQLAEVAGGSLRDPGGELDSLEALEPRFGIRYLAPLDARATGLPAGSVDFVSSTNTLEHVPADDIVPVLAECRRLLRPTGVLSCHIDLRDHFSYGDRTISPYNFLRFSARAWSFVNSRVEFQNRLRLSDHVRRIEAAGFEIAETHVIGPEPADLASLRSVPLAEPFRGYALDDLAAKAVRVVARPLRDSG